MKNIPLILFLFLSFSGITAQKPAKIKKATRYVVVDDKNKKRLEIEYNKKRRETRWADFDEKTGDLISEVLKTYKGKRLLREVYRQHEDSGKVKIDSNIYYYNWLGKKTKKLMAVKTPPVSAKIENDIPQWLLTYLLIATIPKVTTATAVTRTEGLTYLKLSFSMTGVSHLSELTNASISW